MLKYTIINSIIILDYNKHNYNIIRYILNNNHSHKLSNNNNNKCSPNLLLNLFKIVIFKPRPKI
jgi:hypothetical protein